MSMRELNRLMCVQAMLEGATASVTPFIQPPGLWTTRDRL